MDSKTETVSDKAMIDAFMGYAKPENNKRYDTAELLAEAITRRRYNKCWDDLMPVVERITNIIDIKVRELIKVNSDLDDPKGWRAYDYRRIDLSTNIIDVHTQVLEFIRWFNSQLYEQ